MAGHLRGATKGGQGIGHALKSGLLGNHIKMGEERPASDLVLVNRAGESKSPYVRGHASNPVAWQLWGDEAIALAKKANRILFVSIGYSACHCKSTRCPEKDIVLT